MVACRSLYAGSVSSGYTGHHGRDDLARGAYNHTAVAHAVGVGALLPSSRHASRIWPWLGRGTMEADGVSHGPAGWALWCCSRYLRRGLGRSGPHPIRLVSLVFSPISSTISDAYLRLGTVTGKSGRSPSSRAHMVDMRWDVMWDSISS